MMVIHVAPGIADDFPSPRSPSLRISPREGGRCGGAESCARRIWRRLGEGGAFGIRWLGALILVAEVVGLV